MNFIHTYKCLACNHHGEVHLPDDSHDGEHAACSVCGAKATLEWDGGMIFDRAVPTVGSLLDEAFGPGRDPHSSEYIAGMRAILEHRINGAPLATPYALGSAQYNEYMAGWREGDAIWRAL
jgi:hypothetical protein